MTDPPVTNWRVSTERASRSQVLPYRSAGRSAPKLWISDTVELLGFPAVFANIGRSIAFPPCSIVDLKTSAPPPGFSV